MRRILTAAVLLILAPLARASGLRTPFGEVLVRRLKIGQTYSMYKLVNLPLRVVNTGDDTVDLKIETIPVKPGEARDGYEPIPSPDWVRVETSTFTLGPSREAVSDVLITIPNDPKLLGRRFQADIWSHTVGARALLVGIRSQLLLQIDSTPPTEDELKKKYVDESLANLDFTILPTSGRAAGVPVGREVDLRKENKIVVKIVNPNDRPLDFRVRSIPVWESAILPPSGYEPADDPNWLKPEQDVLKVDGNSIADVSARLTLPDLAKFKGRHLFFILSFEVLEQRIPTRVFYRLVVDTADDSKAGSAEKK